MSIERKLKRVNSGKKKIAVEFSGKNLTPFGGIGVFSQFVRKLEVEKTLEKEVNLARRENKYSVGRMLLSIIHSLVLDISRLRDTIILRMDRVFLKLAGFSDFPVHSTISRFLKAFSVSVAKRIGLAGIRLLKIVRKDFEEWSSITLDLDTHVRTVYGNQQRAKKGYNPKKRNRKSYQPLFCFIGETRDFLWGKFRPGKTVSGKEAIGFLRKCLSHISGKINQIRLRADSGFYSEIFLKFLESRRIIYAVVAKIYEPIQCELWGLKYRSIGCGYEVGEFEYQARDKWSHPRRMIVVREKIKEGKNEKKQLKLFKLQGYSYQVIVTNWLEASPEEVWRWYNGRANVENMIKEGIMSFALDVNPSHWYGANMAHFFLIMLSYNLMNWFKEIGLAQVAHKHMAKWVRQKILYIPGELVKRSRKLVLKLSNIWPWQREYKQAEERIERWQPVLI